MKNKLSLLVNIVPILSSQLLTLSSNVPFLSVSSATSFDRSNCRKQLFWVLVLLISSRLATTDRVLSFDSTRSSIVARVRWREHRYERRHTDTTIRYYPSLVLCGRSCLACRVNISTIRRMLQLYVSSSRCLVSFGSDDTTNWCNFVTYIIADRRCSTRQIKEIQSSGNRSLREILVLRYEKQDRRVSTDRVVSFSLERCLVLLSYFLSIAFLAK